MVDLTIESGALSPRNARVGNENVEATVEFLDDFVDSILYWLPAGNIDLVCLAYEGMLAVSVMSEANLRRESTVRSMNANWRV